VSRWLTRARELRDLGGDADRIMRETRLELAQATPAPARTYAVTYVLDADQPTASGFYVVELEGGEEVERHGPWNHQGQADTYRLYLEEWPIHEPRD